MKSIFPTARRAAGRQCGAVLIVSLIILLMMTIIGVTAMNTNTLEERMAGNTRDRNLAFQAAESALRGGEEWLMARRSIPEPLMTCTGSNCVWSQHATAIEFLDRKDHAWWMTTATPLTAGTIPEVIDQPAYLLAELDYVPDSLTLGIGYPPTGRYFYRISGRGTGATGEDNNGDGTLDDFFARVLLETSFTRRY